VVVSPGYLGGYTDDSLRITVTPLNHDGQFPANGVDEIIITLPEYMGTMSEVTDNGDGTYTAWLHAPDDECIRDSVFVSVSAGGQMTDINHHPRIYIYLCGDADHTCSISILDVTYLINYIYKGGPEPNPPEAGDPNGDGNTNILDITYLINFMYKGGSPPVCP